jgi:DtxR family transcriptional regulator, Mn-dependent transcriptional regulator
MDTERTQEYLEAIYKRQEDETPVSTSALAEDLKVSQPAITDMLRSLDNKGLIDYAPGRGATLTGLGTEKALGVIRRHRLWERFLVDVLGMEWDQVHEQACLLEHVTSPEMEEKMAGLLGNVDTCPHGHSIPDKNGHLKKEEARSLTSFKAGQKVYIQAVGKEEPALLHKIDSFGLQPHAIVSIVRKEKNGAMEIEMAGKNIKLDEETAADLRPRPYVTGEAAAVKESPLSSLKPGQTGVIRTCEGGRGRQGRCLSLGFTPGSSVKMLENFSHGPVLVKLHDTEVALGREMAENVMVTREEVECR